MNHTIPKKTLVALPDFSQSPYPIGYSAESFPFKIVPPEQAFIPAFDRSFLFGDSLYEVLRTYNGILFSNDQHFKRLKRSAEYALFDELPALNTLQQMIHDTCKNFFMIYGNQEVYIRYVISRGVGDLNIDPKTSSAPYPVVFVKSLELPTEETIQNGLHYAVVQRHRNLPTALNPAMKSGNYLNNILALHEARQLGAHDAVILNHHGFVTEGTTNNIFIVKDNTVYTPPLSIGILAGITRDWIFKICSDEKISIQEKLFTAQELQNSDEAFMSSSIKEVLSITKVSHQPIANGKTGPITKKIQKSFKKLITDFIKKHQSESLFL